MKYKCNECCDGCNPAEYGCSFDIQASPYDASTWVVTQNGMSHKIKVPKINETDTTLSTNFTNATLDYKAEKHNDIITGAQLGDIINVKDLRDVDFDPGLDGTCSELIFRKFTDCGAGCQSASDRWSNFNINSNGAKQDAIRYVRGANAYGCPVFLDTPENLDQYWFAGWKTDGEHKEFGYYQPEKVDKLPTNENGDVIVLSEGNDGRPLVGALPLQCIFQNFMGNFGTNVYGTWSVIQATPAFSADFNNISGDFSMNWNDWYPDGAGQHVGSGRLTGKLNWDATFDTTNGNMKYHIKSISFYRASYTTDRGVPAGTSHIFLTVNGVSIPGGGQTPLLNRYEYTGNESWNVDINRTIQCDQTISVAPGQTIGPMNFAYIYVDWVGDDEGYLQVNFQNKLQGWVSC